MRIQVPAPQAGHRVLLVEDNLAAAETLSLCLQDFGWLPVHVETCAAALAAAATQPFDIVLTSPDVIHSFWVPQLGGKMDAIPGHRNIHRLMADAPGIHEGLCAEFCGLGHAAMRFEVVVYDPAAPPPFLSAESRP